jgi:hypothetical protein
MFLMELLKGTDKIDILISSIDWQSWQQFIVKRHNHKVKTGKHVCPDYLMERSG